MLSQDNLAQLKGLKSQMEAEKERAEAVIKGTQARYGFAVLDDGREIFIPPQEMLKAFPDDRVKICIRPAKDNRTIADIEKLVDSPLTDFTGSLRAQGQGHVRGTRPAPVEALAVHSSPGSQWRQGRRLPALLHPATPDPRRQTAGKSAVGSGQ